MDQTTLCNLALSMAGTRSTIANLSEGSTESNACALWLTPALTATLRGAHWNFARKQINLALLADASVTGQVVPAPWAYEYAYPADCLLARAVMPVYQSTPGLIPGGLTTPEFVGQPVRFVVSSDVNTSGTAIAVILTNQPQATLVYTADVTVINLFDSEFDVAFATTLAAYISFTLTGDKALRKELFADAQGLLSIAHAHNANEGITVIDTAPDWMRVRGYASDWAYPDGGGFYYGPQALTMIS